jgi:hypothetical protein
MRPFSLLLTHSLTQVAPNFLESFRQAQEAVVSLGNKGWCLTPTETLGFSSEANKVLEQQGEDALADWLVNYYSPTGEPYKALRSELLDRLDPGRFGPLLEECLWAYEQGKYHIAVPGLFVAIEGLVVDRVGRSQERDTNPKNTMRCVEHPEEDSVMALCFQSLLGFLDAVYVTHSFSDPQRSIINRHWVIHGRHIDFGTAADTVRLIMATSSIILFFNKL